jgi:hypothetical protein
LVLRPLYATRTSLLSLKPLMNSIITYVCPPNQIFNPVERN